MNTTQAAKIIGAKINQLQSGERAQRKEAAQLGQLLGAWNRGRIGDCQLINAAK